MVGRPRTATDLAIFDAVAQVVNEAGPTGLTLAAVGDRVGVSAPALVQRFGSKRGLLLAFSAHGADAVDAAFDQPRGRNNAIADTIIAALLQLASGMGSRRELANNLAFLQLDLIDEGLRVHAVAHSRNLRRRLVRALVEGVDLGELSVDDPNAVAELLYAVYNGALVSWAIDGKGSLAHWLRDRIERVLELYEA